MCVQAESNTQSTDRPQLTSSSSKWEGMLRFGARAKFMCSRTSSIISRIYSGAWPLRVPTTTTKGEFESSFCKDLIGPKNCDDDDQGAKNNGTRSQIYRFVWTLAKRRRWGKPPVVKINVKCYKSISIKSTTASCECSRKASSNEDTQTNSVPCDKRLLLLLLLSR